MKRDGDRVELRKIRLIAVSAIRMVTSYGRAVSTERYRMCSDATTKDGEWKEQGTEEEEDRAWMMGGDGVPPGYDGICQRCKRACGYG